ncbi:MAG: PDC sensor domain-containing protein [Thioalkalispiraceae bacterium]|jgi:hypothetical protein
MSSSSWVKQVIAYKKSALAKQAEAPMAKLASRCAEVWEDPDRLDDVLQEAMAELPHCDLIFAVDTNGIIISSNVETDYRDEKWRGRDMNGRPFMEGTLPYKGFTISPVYISTHNMKSCITVMQAVNKDDRVLGFIAADFDVDHLPVEQSKQIYDTGWRQYKGDPAIRGTLFLQERVKSAMDARLDEVMDAVLDMLLEHGVFHFKIHFSSSRMSFWHVQDPYDYKIHMVDDILDPESCLAFPRVPYTERATIPREKIKDILDMFKMLRNADETVYLRSASLNIVNGMVGLTFSCDGSHYLHYTDFLAMDRDFWFGKDTSKESA